MKKNAFGYVRLAVCSFLLTSLGCSAQGTSEARCQVGFGMYELRYTGEAAGFGELSLEGAESALGVVAVLKFKPEETSTESLATVSGQGECNQGEVKLRFPGARIGEIEVVGVELTGMLARPGAEAYGMWTAELTGSESSAPRPAGGFWRARKK